MGAGAAMQVTRNHLLAATVLVSRALIFLSSKQAKWRTQLLFLQEMGRTVWSLLREKLQWEKMQSLWLKINTPSEAQKVTLSAFWVCFFLIKLFIVGPNETFAGSRCKLVLTFSRCFFVFLFFFPDQPCSERGGS